MQASKSHNNTNKHNPSSYAVKIKNMSVSFTFWPALKHQSAKSSSNSIHIHYPTLKNIALNNESVQCQETHVQTIEKKKFHTNQNILLPGIKSIPLAVILIQANVFIALKQPIRTNMRSKFRGFLVSPTRQTKIRKPSCNMSYLDYKNTNQYKDFSPTLRNEDLLR